jgi:hypothetical protein
VLVGWASKGMFLPSIAAVCKIILVFSCAFELLKDRQEMTMFNVIFSPCFKNFLWLLWQ